jgi:tetratricopeptide (TPR) repeat protein
MAPFAIIKFQSLLRIWATAFLSLLVLGSSVYAEPTAVPAAGVKKPVETAVLTSRHAAQAKGLTHYVLGINYDLLDQPQQAVAEYERAAFFRPDEFAIQLRLGAGYARVNRLPEAIAALNAAAALNEEDLQAHYLLALIYSSQRDYDRAAEEYEKILTRFSHNDPNNIEIYGYLGQLYYSQQKYDKAIVQFQRILTIQPDNTDVMYMLGSLFLEVSDRDSAIDQFKKAIEIDPNHDGCLNSLGYVYAEDGVHLDQAQALVERALNINPQSGAYLDSLGWVYYKKGLYQQALTYLQKADSFIKDPVIYDHLGDVYLQLNEIENARKYWKLALELYPGQDEIINKLKSLDQPQQAKSESTQQ